MFCFQNKTFESVLRHGIRLNFSSDNPALNLGKKSTFEKEGDSNIPGKFYFLFFSNIISIFVAKNIIRFNWALWNCEECCNLG